MTSSTNISVSCLGINTFSLTKKFNFINSLWWVICSNGTPCLFIAEKYWFSSFAVNLFKSFTIIYCLGLFKVNCINNLAFNFGVSISAFFSSIIPFFIASIIVILPPTFLVYFTIFRLFFQLYCAKRKKMFPSFLLYLSSGIIGLITSSNSSSDISYIFCNVVAIGLPSPFLSSSFGSEQVYNPFFSA